LRLSLTHTIFAITALIALLLSSVIIIYGRQSSREQALLAADAMMEAGVGIVLLRTEAMIRPVAQTIALSRYWQDTERPPSDGGLPLRQRLAAILTHVEQLSSIAIGYDNGDSYVMLPISRYGATSAAPSGSALVELVIASVPSGATLSFLDANGDVLASRPVAELSFDPRQRPWFDVPSSASGVIRTPFYQSAGDGKTGFALAQRTGQRVTAAQITLEGLEAFLDTALPTDDALLAIIDRDGNRLAGSQRAGRLRPETLVRAAQTSLRAATTEFEGELVLYRKVPIDLGGGVPETLIAVLPVASVTRPIDRLATRSALVSIALLLASMPIIWLVASRMSRPLLRLVQDAERIRAFDLEAAPRQPSPVREIERLERAMRMMREGLGTFAVYVPKALVRRLVERGEPPRIGGNRQEITVLFLDLENFTQMAAGLEPDELMSRMSTYFEIVSGILLEHEATIDKYIGDAVMAFWNAPDQTSDHHAKACAAALAIQARTKDLTDRWSRDSGIRLRTRIGLNCGPAVVGNVGSSDRMNYTALGATVNLASRLENLNRTLATDILISADLRQRIGDRFVTEAKGGQTIKGYAAPVEVFALKRRR